MGRIGKVISWAAAKLTGDVTNDTGGGVVRKSQLFSDSGVDAPPLKDDYVAVVDSASRNRTMAVGVVDGKNASTAKPGERRTYARKADGTIAVELYMQADGSARLFNQNGYIQLMSSGEVEINGARITTEGDVITATGVSLDQHKHLAGEDLLDSSGGINTGVTGEPEK